MIALNKIPDTRALMSITNRPSAAMVRGAGSYIWDNSGKRYLDFVQGWAVNALGHCAPEIVNALHEQSQSLITPSPAYHNVPQLALAQRVTQLSGLAQVHFSNSGAEANEVAIKLARKWGQFNRPDADEIITTHNSFHGRTLATMAATGKPGWETLFKPSVPGFRKVPYGDIDAMINTIDSKTLAVMVEPIQGEAGVIVPPAGYLAQLREITRKHGILLILDEIQTGVGRTGTFFAFEQHKEQYEKQHAKLHEELHSIKPDIVTLGKGLGGGVPISATLASANACCFEHGDQGGTYNGNPLMAAVALAVVDTVAEVDFLKSIQRAGERVKVALQQIDHSIGCKEVRGNGLLWAIELPAPIAASVQAHAMDAGLLVNAPRPSSIRLMPALNVTDSEIDEAMVLLSKAIEQSLCSERQS